MRSVITAWFGSRTAVCVFLAGLVFASRAWLIQTWGSPSPIWDQWNVESALYRAWLTNTLRWSDFFAAHNEHRVALTRLADLALFALCGGWNLWAQMLLNAALHAVTSACLLATFWNRLTVSARPLLAVGFAVLFVVPSGWQNALWGFQSQVYFTNLLAVVAFAALAFRSPTTMLWWFGWAALLLGLFANAGGLLTALAGIALIWPPRVSRSGLLASLPVLGVALLGIAMIVTVPAHAPLHAQNPGQFFAVLTRSLSWPYVNSGWAWLVLQLPLPLLCLRRWVDREPMDAGDRLALALVAFAILHAAAVAHSRGAGLLEFRPLSRYQDPLLLGVAAQLFAALRLAGLARRPGRLFALGWSAVVALGIVPLAVTNFSVNLPHKRLFDRTGLAQVRTYLESRDVAALSDNATLGTLHPDPAVVKHVLDDPVLRPALPREFFDEIPLPLLLRHAPHLFLLALALFVAAFASISGADHLARTQRKKNTNLTAGARGDGR